MWPLLVSFLRLILFNLYSSHEGKNECSTSNGGCSHHCVDLKSGHRCECPLGYKLQSDKRTCKDVDECLEVGICSQFCVNEKGSYKCKCDEGFQLLSNRKTCKVKGKIVVTL